MWFKPNDIKFSFPKTFPNILRRRSVLKEEKVNSQTVALPSDLSFKTLEQSPTTNFTTLLQSYIIYVR